MPIGKDSIQKRVAKATEAAPVEEVKVEAAAPTEQPAAQKTSTAKTTSAGAKKPAAPKAAAAKTASTGTKKTTTAAKKSSAPKADKPAEAPVVDTAVLANVSPETVAAVIGHDEKKPSEKVQIGQKMPTYLL